GIGDGDRPVRGLHLPPPDDDAARAYPSVPVTADQWFGPGPRTGQTTRSRGRSARCAAEGGLTMSDQTREPVKAPRRSLAARLYLGEVGINIADWRRRWLAIAGVLVVIAILGILVRGFSFGIEFEGGNAFQVPASVGTLQEVEDAVGAAGATVVSAQEVGSPSGGATYLIRTLEVSSEQ